MFLRDRIRLPKLSLKWALTIPLVVQTVGIVGLVGYLSYTSGQRSIQKLAYQLMANVEQQVSRELDGYLQRAHEFNQQQAAAMQAGVITPQDLAQLHRHLILQHRQAQELTTLLFGTPQGDLLVSHRVSPRDYGVTTRLTPQELPFEVAVSRSTKPQLNQTYAVDTAGNLGRHLKTVHNIDVRDRPWYRHAVKTGEPGWTAPFQIADTNLLALNAQEPVFDSTGELIGVFAVNISLNQLSDRLREIQVGDSGQIFILERNSQLIASSTPEQVYTTIGDPDLSGVSEPGTVAFDRRSLDDTPDPLLQRAYQQLQATFGDFANLRSLQQIEFSVSRERYFLTIAPYQQDGADLDWLVATIVPASDFMADIQQNNRTTALLCLLALGGAIASGTVLSKRIAQRFEQLNQAGQALAQGEFEQTLPTDSAIAEVQGLATAFNQLAAQLQRSFQQQVDAEATRQSEARFQQLATAVPGVIYAFTILPDSSYHYEYVSSFSQNLLELPPEQILADASIILNQIHPEDRPAVFDAMQQAAEKSELFCQTYRITTPSGQLKWIEESARPRHYPDGRITWYGILLDVSDRQFSHVAIQESELRYRILAESSPVGIFRHDREGQCIYANTQTLEMIGLSLEEVLQHEWGKHLHPDDRDRIYATWQAFVERVNRGELASYATEQRYLFPDGSLKWGLAQAVPEYNTAGEVVGFVGSIADITDLKQTEASLKAKTEELDGFFSVALDLLCIADLEGTFLRLNPQWETTLGYPIAELEGSQIWDYLHLEDVDATQAAIAQLARQETVESFVNRYRCRDGSYRWIEWRSVPVGSLIYAAARDITEHQQTEAALRFSEARKQSILSAIPDLIFLLDAQGVYLEAIRSNAVVDVADAASNKIGKHVSELVPPEIAQRHLQAILQVLQTRHIMTFEQEVQTGDRIQYEEVTVVPCETDTVLFLIRDISERHRHDTERQRLETDLRSLNAQLQELATVDSLTQVANRRQMEWHLQQEWDRCLRAQAPLTLILLDIDHFKRYNDQYGHPQGDACLRQVADILQSHVNRPGDLVSRYGGEEFLLVLPHTEQQGATHLASTIRQSLAQAQIPHAASLTHEIVTVSMGVATIMDINNFDSPIEAIVVTDELLYKAKQIRNTYCLQVF